MRWRTGFLSIFSMLRLMKTRNVRPTWAIALEEEWINAHLRFSYAQFIVSRKFNCSLEVPSSQYKAAGPSNTEGNIRVPCCKTGAPVLGLDLVKYSVAFLAHLFTCLEQYTRQLRMSSVRLPAQYRDEMRELNPWQRSGNVETSPYPSRKCRFYVIKCLNIHLCLSLSALHNARNS